MARGEARAVRNGGVCGRGGEGKGGEGARSAPGPFSLGPRPPPPTPPGTSPPPTPQPSKQFPCPSGGLTKFINPIKRGYRRSSLAGGCSLFIFIFP